MIKVLMVCTGNICRSPMAEYVLKAMVEQAGLSDQISVDSAGISAEEVGNTVHHGTVNILRKYGIQHDGFRPARQITGGDIQDFDYLLAMDSSHLRNLQRRVGDSKANVSLFLSDAVKSGAVTYEDVPDPWYDGKFDLTYDLVTKGCAAFLQRLRAEQAL
ncbi:MAG: low molecular weight phosphotyrosine protein phosphatase [Chloroflexi bacterium]|nr:low molecular weight phosphotyrosine protein phosphatase [Chloroflexota bacterium]MCC6892440.1 low molecular weight phosphotyrosine protein phosphatase [Anaerolineae bacterium]